jgi:hypothetical protein
MGMLENAAQWLDGQRRQHLSLPVIYRRRDGSEVGVAATLGKTLFRAENEYGVTIRVESRDFIVSAADLPSDPERGDRIIYAERLYEVLAPNGEPCWRWSGANHAMRRIHTKEIGAI